MNTSGSRNLRIVEGEPSKVALICRRPTCTEVVPPAAPGSRGRPLEFCTPECGEKATAELHAAEAELRRAQAVVDQYKRPKGTRRRPDRVGVDTQTARAVARNLETVARQIDADRLAGTLPSGRRAQEPLEELLAVAFLAITALDH
jgi:hypothetical protein